LFFENLPNFIPRKQEDKGSMMDNNKRQGPRVNNKQLSKYPNKPRHSFIEEIITHIDMAQVSQIQGWVMG
jgi:hypothetical protein